MMKIMRFPFSNSIALQFFQHFRVSFLTRTVFCSQQRDDFIVIQNKSAHKCRGAKYMPLTKAAFNGEIFPFK